MAELEQLIEQCNAEEREQVLLAAYYVAFADGRFWRDKSLLERIARELGISEKTARRQMYLVQRLNYWHQKRKLTAPEGQAARQLAYHYALAVAASDGKLTGPEREIAEMLGAHLGMVEKAVAAELDASVPTEEPKRRRSRRSRKRRPQAAKPDDYPAMLTGLVGKESEAQSPLLARFTSLSAMGAAALVVAALLWAVFSGGETPQKAGRPAKVGETPETGQPVDDASKPQPEPQPRPDPGLPLLAEAPLESGLLEREVDGTPVLFPDGPPLAVTPFTAEEAKAHQQAWAEYLEIHVETTNSIGMKLVLIPPGAFVMGSPEDEEGRRAHEGPQHWVRITRPFYTGKYEVTQEQWQAVMGSNPSSFQGPDNPVEKVSWNDCQAFIGKLNERFGQSGATFSLPTEAQWEYACRAGSTGGWCFGDDEASLGEYAWRHGMTAEVSTYPVGQKKPNAWGLCDVHGNVTEWCADCYRGSTGSPSWYYEHSPLDDPTGPTSGRWRVVRGGAWGSSRCAGRTIHTPGNRDKFGGLRVVRSIPPVFLELPEEVSAQPAPN